MGRRDRPRSRRSARICRKIKVGKRRQRTTLHRRAEHPGARIRRRRNRNSRSWFGWPEAVLSISSKMRSPHCCTVSSPSKMVRQLTSMSSSMRLYIGVLVASLIDCPTTRSPRRRGRGLIGADREGSASNRSQRID
jgi:hypothetical protein